MGSIWGLTAGLAGLRLSGQGALSLLATTTVALWFTRNRGASLGVVSSVGAAGISATPVLTEQLIAATDWRTAWLVQGLIVWTALTPRGVFGLRGRPPASLRGSTGPHPAAGWTVSRAMRTAAFWTIIAAVCCQGMLTTAVAFHQVSLLGEHGLSPTEAAANFLPQTLAGLCTAFLVGPLADRFPPRLVLGACLGVLATGLLWTPLLAPGISAVMFGLLLGAAANGIRTLEALRGIVHGATVASTAFGPVFLALGHNLAGSYTPALVFFAAAPALIGLLVALVRPPRLPAAGNRMARAEGSR